MTTFNRRQLVKLGLVTSGATLFGRGSRLLGAPAAEPHFFLQLFFDGSLDTSYLFDARPLAMTAAGLVQNYLGQEPELWTGANGGKTLVSPLVAPLAKYKQRMAILNGVMMAVGFDGHEQNKNALLAGSPFGGESFVPHIMHAGGKNPALDYLQVGSIFGLELTNTATSVTLDPYVASTFTRMVKENASGSKDPVDALIDQRLAAVGGGTGRFGAGARGMREGLAQSDGLAATLRTVEFDVQPNAEGPAVAAAVRLAGEYFRRGVTGAAILAISDLTLDTHAARDAKQQPDTYAKVVASIEAVLGHLATTPFDEARGLSLLDVTTVLIGSEFSRTNRQEGKRIDDTGTDHNPLANGMVLVGKGIRGDQIIGASDLDQLDAQNRFARVSKAHESLDPQLLKRMGKPFDFAATQALDTQPEVFSVDQHLTVASVVNTLYEAFGADASRHWTNARNGPVARTLKGLLV